VPSKVKDRDYCKRVKNKGNVNFFSYSFIYFMNRLKKTTQNTLIITSLWIEIITEALTNTKHKCSLHEIFFLVSEIDF
jgi:hypothetical protein